MDWEPIDVLSEFDPSARKVQIVKMIDVLVPKKYNQWIEGNYGPSWNTSAFDWDWYFDPRNYVDEIITEKPDFSQEMANFGKNLLKNPSFEFWDNDTNLPLHWNSTTPECFTRDDNNTYFGWQSLQVNGDGQRCMLTQTVQITNTLPTTLLVGGWSKLQDKALTWKYDYSIHVKGNSSHGPFGKYFMNVVSEV
jgi:hypothetical protein